jgi:hypothetical protein
MAGGPSWKEHGPPARAARRADVRLVHIQRHALGRGHRRERRAPSRQMMALVVHSIPSLTRAGGRGNGRLAPELLAGI